MTDAVYLLPFFSFLTHDSDSGETSMTCKDRVSNLEGAQSEITTTRLLVVAIGSQILEVDSQVRNFNIFKDCE